MSRWLSEVWDNLSCLNLCVHSHSLCQHLNLVVILKLAQRKPWSPVLVLPFHVPAPKLLGVTRREAEAQRGCHCCATQTPLLQQPCPGAAPQPLLYAQGCRKPPLCSCAPAGRKQTVGWMGVSVLLGIMLDKTLLQKGCSKLQAVPSAQQFVLSSSGGGCKIQQVL